MISTPISFTADGRRVDASPHDGAMTLASYLRDFVGITSINVGCEEGACGACTALVDGRPVPTCLMFVARADGAVIETAAAIAETRFGAAIIRSIVEGAGLQCGFCTPGIVCTTFAYLTEATAPVDNAAVAAALSGHLCRCTGYQSLVSAVVGAAEQVSVAGRG